MIKIDCIVVEDDPMASHIVESLIEKTACFNLVKTCRTISEAFDILCQQKIDLMFLSIEMPEMNGLQFIETLEKKPIIVLISNKKDYVEEAFEKDVTDYLIKPFYTRKRFFKTVSKVLEKIDSKQNLAHKRGFLFMKIGASMNKFNLNDIFWVQSRGNKVVIHTSEGLYVVNNTLNAMLGILPSSDFVQIHRSYIVRIDKIASTNFSVVQVEGNKLPVGRLFKPVLSKHMNII